MRKHYASLPVILALSIFTIACPNDVAPPSSDAGLSALSLSADGASVSLSPSFDSATLAYSASVDPSVASVIIEASASDAGASLAGTGRASLAVGATSLPIVVTAADGATTRTYTITVTRAAPRDASLAALSIVNGDEGVALDTIFAKGTLAYTARLPNSADTVRAYATPSDPSASVVIMLGDASVPATVTSEVGSNDPVFTGTASLAVGVNALSFVVTAADGLTQATYRLEATRVEAGLNPDKTLVSLVVKSNGSAVPLATEAGKGGRLSYSGDVADSVTSVEVTATGRNTGELIYGNGSAALVPGLNRLRVVVTAADGTAATTFIAISRGPVATLADYVGTWTGAGLNPVITLTVDPDGSSSYREAYATWGEAYEARLSVDAATGSGTLAGTSYRSYETYDYDDAEGTLAFDDYTYYRSSGSTETIAGEWAMVSGLYTLSIRGDGTLTSAYNGTPARTGTGAWDATSISFDGERALTRGVLIRLGAPSSLRLELDNEAPILTKN